MLVFDSCVWIALFLSTDSLHGRVVIDMRSAREEQILLPDFVVREAATVLAYRGNKDVADSFLRFCEGNSQLIQIQGDVRAESALFLSVPKRFSFVDVALIRAASETGARLLTYDEDLAKFIRQKSR